MNTPKSMMTKSDSSTIKPESLFVNVDGVQKDMFSMELQRCFITEKGVEIQIVKVSNVLSFKCVCLQCGRNFVTRDLLQLHMETHLQSDGNGFGASVRVSSSNKGNTTNNVRFPDNVPTCAAKTSENLDRDIDSKIGVLGADMGVAAFTGGDDDDDDDDSHVDDSTAHDDSEPGNSTPDNQRDNIEDQSIGADIVCVGLVDNLGDGEGIANIAKTNPRDDSVYEMFETGINRSQKDSSGACSGSPAVNESSELSKSLTRLVSPIKVEPGITQEIRIPSKSREMSAEQANEFNEHDEETQRLLEADGVTLECQICGKNVTGGQQKFIDHVNRHAGEKPYLCPVCSHGFATRVQLDGHSKKHGPKRGGLHACSVCGKQFKKSAVLKVHYAIHEERRHSCTICGKRFHWKWKVSEHMRTHTGVKPYPCPTCGKGFSSRYNMRCHLSVHTGEKPYKCVTCERTFVTSSQLKSHTRVHTGEKSNLCTVCGKAFSAPANLKKHMAVHQNLIFKCSVCDKVFKYEDSLRQHHKINHGNNAVACEVCGKTFRHQRYLVSHLRLHKKLYTCSECDKTYSSKRNLQDHMKKHEQTVQCLYCGFVASSRKLLSKHIKEQHRTLQYAEASQVTQQQETTGNEEMLQHREATQHEGNKQDQGPMQHQTTYRDAEIEDPTISMSMPSNETAPSADMNWNVGIFIDELTDSNSEIVLNP